MASFQRNVYGKTHAPLMAEITLTSSHTPWAPIPHTIDANAVGDGSVYGPMAAQGRTKGSVWKNKARVRAEYAKSIAYSVQSTASWAAKYGNDNLVLIFFGDHQAAATVSGQGAGHDVPITIVAKDPAMLSRVADWGWQDGLRPSPQAPVWKMSAFRDRFLTAFAHPAEPPAKASH
jgi:hypothetical protein